MKTMLDKLQTILRVNVRSIIKASLWVNINYGIQIGIGIVTTIILANTLDKVTLGTYQYILAVGGILSIFTLSGLGTALTRGVAQGNDGLLRYSVRLKLKWSLGIIFSSLVVASYYLYQGNSELGLAFLIVGACAPFIESFKLYENYLHGKEAWRHSVMIGIWRKPLPLIAVITTAYIYPEPLALISAYFVSNGISYTLVYLSVIKKYRPPLAADTETHAYSKHLSVIRGIGIIASHIDKLFIWHLLGPTPVASYTIAQFSTRYVSVLLTSLSAIALPRFSKQSLDTLKETLPRKVLLLTAGMVVISVVYIIIAPPLFNIFFPDYTESILLTQVLALSFIFIPRQLYAQVFTAHQKTEIQYLLSIVTPTLLIAQLAILIPLFGTMGAVYAQLLTGTVLWMLTYFMFRRL